jgi:hypothetical protein
VWAAWAAGAVSWSREVEPVATSKGGGGITRAPTGWSIREGVAASHRHHQISARRVVLQVRTSQDPSRDSTRERGGGQVISCGHHGAQSSGRVVLRGSHQTPTWSRRECVVSSRPSKHSSHHQDTVAVHMSRVGVVGEKVGFGEMPRPAEQNLWLRLLGAGPLVPKTLHFQRGGGGVARHSWHAKATKQTQRHGPQSEWPHGTEREENKRTERNQEHRSAVFRP